MILFIIYNYDNGKVCDSHRLQPGEIGGRGENKRREREEMREVIIVSVGQLQYRNNKKNNNNNNNKILHKKETCREGRGGCLSSFHNYLVCELMLKSFAITEGLINVLRASGLIKDMRERGEERRSRMRGRGGRTGFA